MSVRDDHSINRSPPGCWPSWHKDSISLREKLPFSSFYHSGRRAGYCFFKPGGAGLRARHLKAARDGRPTNSWLTPTDQSRPGVIKLRRIKVSGF